MRKRNNLRIQKTKYRHVFSLCSRAPHNLVKCTALCDIVHCNLRLLFIILFNQVERQMLGAIHLITHPPSCKHLISRISFQHPVFQHQSTRIPGSPRIVNLLPLPKFTLIGTLFGCIFLISSILYSTHLHPSISSFSQYFSLCSSVVSSLASYYYLSPRNLLFPLLLPLVQTLPFPLCCNKNSVKLNLFVSLALTKRTTSKVK